MNKDINFLDLTKQHQNLKKKLLNEFEKVIDKTAFSGGKFVEDFENKFANECSTKYSIGVNSGTSAIHLAILALGIGKGDEVIIPANTFIATAWGVSYTGAIPVFVDCTADTWQIDPSKIEEKITKKTKAIIGVHLYGQPFNVEKISKIAKKHNLFLIEDAAQAFGAKYKHKPVGEFGEIGCFSFYPGKNLGACGEGGAITTNSKKIYQEISQLRNHGSSEKYYHNTIGYNYRMGGIEAASLLIKLNYIDTWNNKRKEIAKRYQSGIKNELITMQTQPKWADSVYHLFVITTPNRKKLIDYLNKNKINPGIHYPVPCHLQKAYKNLNYKKGDLPNVEFLAEHCLSLPIYPELNDNEVSKIIDCLNLFQG